MSGMTAIQPMTQVSLEKKAETEVNNFSITVGTANGSGSQTSNLTILRALFKMGIPVSGKNLFPSNIQGLPTWYTIRLSKDGFLSRCDEQEIVIAINPDSFSQDLVREAGRCFLLQRYPCLSIEISSCIRCRLSN
jgi:2-oxoglutarate ferredoxin oxidoreductase subunit alpha